MSFSQQYHEHIASTLNKVLEKQRENLQSAASHMADAIESGGLIHVFGCGHSHMLAEEMFYRAGGLVDIDPIFDSSVMLHEGAAKSSQIERLSGIAAHLLSRYPVRRGDVLLVSSTSGINSYPIEMAIAAKEKGCFVIGITSMDYARLKSRHPSQKHLFDVCDLAIDNYVKQGDACVCLNDKGVYAGPISSISTFFIANIMILETCQILMSHGKEPRIFTSGNLEGADEINSEYISAYQERIKHL